MRRRDFLKGSAALGVAATLATARRARAQGRTGTVRVWGEPGPYAAVAVDAMNEWAKANAPGLTFAVETLSWTDVYPKLMTDLAAGRPAPAGEVVLARVWDPQGGECGMLVKILIDTNCLESDGDDGQEPVLASRVEVIGPVISVRPPARRPRTARESTRRRRDMRSAAQRVARMLQVFEELLPEQRRILLAALQQRMAAESPGNGREQR